MGDRFVIITQTFFEPGMKEQVLTLVRKSFPIFQKQKGLIRLQNHLCQGDTHTMSFIEWESKADSDACMQSLDFTILNQQWEALLSTGKVRFKLMAYDTIDS